MGFLIPAIAIATKVATVATAVSTISKAFAKPKAVAAAPAPPPIIISNTAPAAPPAAREVPTERTEAEIKKEERKRLQLLRGRRTQTILAGGEQPTGQVRGRTLLGG